MEIFDPPMSFLFALPIITYISYDITKKVQIRGFAMVLLLFDFLEKMIAFWNMEYPPKKKHESLQDCQGFLPFWNPQIEKKTDLRTKSPFSPHFSDRLWRLWIPSGLWGIWTQCYRRRLSIEAGMGKNPRGSVKEFHGEKKVENIHLREVRYPYPL